MADRIIPASLSDDQNEYLSGLRQGTPIAPQLIIRNEVTGDMKSDFENFRAFLMQNSQQASPIETDLWITVSRQAFLRLLYYADDRDRRCLVIQNCFGLTNPPVFEQGKKLGQILLIQKANFQQKEGQTDSDLYFGDTVYRNGQGQLELFRNMKLDDQLKVDEARSFINNFLQLYPDVELTTFIHGFLLPVKPLITLLTDPASDFNKMPTYSFRWGLTRFNQNSIGNFTLAIGSNDVTTGQAIEFRTLNIDGAGAGDCPPKTGCSL